MSLPASGTIKLSQIAQAALSNTANDGTPYKMSTFVLSPIVLVGGSNSYVTSGGTVTLGRFVGGTLPTNIPHGPSLLLTSRQMNFYNINMGGNTNKWADYNAVFGKYGLNVFIYFFFCGGIYRIRFNGAENGQIRNTDFQYYDSSYGWSTATATQLPTYTVLTMTEVEDKEVLASTALTTTNVGCMYSVRLLRRAYTGAVLNIRRGSDNVVADFYASPIGPLLFNSSYQELSKWLNGATGYVATWYDQSGNGNNATQTTTACQPTIVYESSSGLYCVFFAGGDVGSNYQGLYLNSNVTTYGIACQMNLQSNSSTWQTIVGTDTDNAGLRMAGNTFMTNSNEGLDYTFTNAYSGYNTGASLYVAGSTYTGATFGAGMTLSNNAWYYVATSRTNSAMVMSRIGLPGWASLNNRAFHGYLSEMILFTSTPSASDASGLYNNRRIK